MSFETKQHGVIYPTLLTDWEVESWFGSVDTLTSQKNFQEQYDLRMRQQNMPTGEVQFVQRTVTYSDSEPLIPEEPDYNVPPPPAENPPAPQEVAPTPEESE